MRVALLPLLLTIPILAGCIGDDDPNPSEDKLPLRGDPDALAAYDAIPEGADYVPMDGGMALVWTEQERPFNTTFQLPEGATMVRFVADPGEGDAVGVAMWNNDTGRRRCNQQTVVGFFASLEGPRSCSSIAFIDDSGANWAVVTSSTGNNLPEVRIEFLHTPLDGLAGQIDWTKLSRAGHDILATEGFYVDSHDGEPLWVEVTKPVGEGPWPAIIASSPYNGQSGRIPDPGSGETAEEGTPAMWRYWTQEYAKRGYVAVNVDVRGFGKSGGCVEIWGENEQLDQAFMVNWVAEQDWSDGNVGFYGQSYVGTTPVAAAVNAPDALKAIIAVAPVIDAYHDWHYGGVRNGESSGSPQAYQVFTDHPAQHAPPADAEAADWATDLPTILNYWAKGVCDPAIVAEANDPRAIHDAYYDERDFGARASEVKAAVLYTQGFEDANVKSAMIGDWFNDIPSTKLGVFGHWVHQHPARMDAEVLFLGWMEEHVKGIDLGITDVYPEVLVSVNATTERHADSWPPAMGEAIHFGLDLDDGRMMHGDGSGEAVLNAPANQVLTSSAPDTTIVLQTEPLTAPMSIVAPTLHLEGTINGENAFLYARIDEILPDGTERLLTYGMTNLALSDDYNDYAPYSPGSSFVDDLPFRPTERLVEAGTALQLTLYGLQAGSTAYTTAQPQPAQLTIDGGASSVTWTDVSLAAYEDIALTTLP